MAQNTHQLLEGRSARLSAVCKAARRLETALAPPQLPSLQQLDLTDNGGIEEGGDGIEMLKGLEAARTAAPRGTNSPAAFVMWLP